ncbi:DUF6760 family protein [Petralouisia muris]|uniref:DUF6760 family protein n=1 Tax=Petralouisia muris TaxID=3032872 RepID=UPI0023B8722B|nr:DUF6760 family protein [Petralouisia muris]
MYPADKIYEEAAFISYYVHWSREEVLELPHRERLRWCREISEINRKVSHEQPEDDIFRI